MTVAVCRICKREQLDGTPCEAEPHHLAGIPYEPIRFGDEAMWVEYSAEAPAICRDCGTPKGAAHHHGCGVEQCPRCRPDMPAKSCGCVVDEPPVEPCRPLNWPGRGR